MDEKKKKKVLELMETLGVPDEDRLKMEEDAEEMVEEEKKPRKINKRGLELLKMPEKK